MKKFRELAEAKGQIVFAFGRFNPPTTGHEKLIAKVASVAGSSDFRIYPSHSQGPKDPLPHALKIAYMRKMFKKYAKNIIADKDAKTAINIAVKLYDEGYTDLVMIAGSDRLKEFDTLLNKYNDVKARHGYYNFNSIAVQSAGERDPDAEGVSGMSASKLRAAAQSGDFDSFKMGIPNTLNDRDKMKLYQDVRKYMGVRESKEDLDIRDDYDALRDAYLQGEWGNIGDIVEANGVSGEVVRRGTNYLSFVDEDGKFHKAFLHQVGEDAWFRSRITDKLGGKLQRKTAPRSFEKMAKQYADLAKKPEYKGKPNMAADAVARQYKGVNTRTLISYINDLVMQGKLPKELRASYMPTFKEATSVKQDKDIKDREGTQPKKYYAKDAEGDEMSKSTKQARARHFEKGAAKDDDDPSAYKPAPGDKSAKTKPSKHTKKVRQMYPDLYDEERDYKKEYANYHSKPEQIERRSSRNKARRIMGDKAVKGKDIGHKDNNPLNNNPKNLRNEDPSKNRREPRLRENYLFSSFTKKVTSEMRNEQKMECPPATQDVALNTKNRNATRDNHMYGPLNVKEPGDYWEKLAKRWKTTLEAAKKSKCGNCVAFDISPRMDECMPGSVSDESGRLGYCWMHHFKCHSARSCDTWATGGPIKEDDKSYQWQEKAFGKEVEEDAVKDARDKIKREKEADKIKHDAMLDRARLQKARNKNRATESLDESWKPSTMSGYSALVDEGLWDNIRKKRQRIKQGSGERMRKKGEKGAPTPAQMQRAKSEEACCDDCGTDSTLIENNLYRVGSEAYYNYFEAMREKYERGELEVSGFDKELMEGDIGKFATYEEQVVPLDCPMMESEYQGKDVELNKPKAGGPKKYYVYVRDPSTGNVKKVTWGDTTGLKVKLSDKGARKSFAARHKCDQQKDKTKAAYWACNLPRYASQLGLSGGGNFFW